MRGDDEREAKQQYLPKLLFHVANPKNVCSLEHWNVVRYYTAWLEEGTGESRSEGVGDDESKTLGPDDSTLGGTADGDESFGGLVAGRLGGFGGLERQRSDPSGNLKR